MVEVSPVLRRRLKRYLSQCQDMIKCIEAGIFDDIDEALNSSLETEDSYHTLLDLYKHAVWKDKFLESAGSLPAISPKNLDRISRKIEQKRVVAYGWYSDETQQLAQCAFCGIHLHIHEVTIDHIVPRSLNGTDEITNLVPACCDCNLEKGNKSPQDYLAEIGVEPEQIPRVIDEWTSTRRKTPPKHMAFRLSDHQSDELGIN